MSISEQLAGRARAPVGAAEAAALRALTLTNMAAGVGERGRLAAVAQRLPLDTSRPPDAAFVYAAQLHARTQDDFFPGGRVHVGAIVLAAALALADAIEDRMLASLAAGYRVMCDVAGVYSTQAQQRGLRPSGVFGPFGAAAATSVALGLRPEEMANALALAAAAAGGHNQAWISGTDEWLTEVGAAARAGVEAALFTRAGIRASVDAFEGRAGWAAAFFDEGGAERLAAVAAGPVIDARVVAVKPYPVSGIAQPSTALACRLHDELRTARPSAVRVWMSGIELGYPGSANVGPFENRSAALMSVAFCVACGLVDGAVRLERLENPGAPDLAAMLARIDVAPDPDLAENEARIEIDLGGERLTRSARAADLLYPAWDDLVADIAGLARRSEADDAVVAAAAAELARSVPDATVLRKLLEGSR
jgi:2-methylcitrate dehydratase PrpD